MIPLATKKHKKMVAHTRVNPLYEVIVNRYMIVDWVLKVDKLVPEANFQYHRELISTVHPQIICNIQHTSDMTMYSLMGSMGGLVTWANSCLKYSNTRGFRSDRQARGMSLPMDPRGSFLK